jgi:hypothetical protein
MTPPSPRTVVFGDALPVPFAVEEVIREEGEGEGDGDEGLR